MDPVWSRARAPRMARRFHRQWRGMFRSYHIAIHRSRSDLCAAGIAGGWCSGDFVATLIADRRAGAVGQQPTSAWPCCATVLSRSCGSSSSRMPGLPPGLLGIGLDEYRKASARVWSSLRPSAVILVSLGWQMSRLLIGVAVPMTFVLTVIVRWLLAAGSPRRRAGQMPPTDHRRRSRTRGSRDDRRTQRRPTRDRHGGGGRVCLGPAGPLMDPGCAALWRSRDCTAGGAGDRCRGSRARLRLGVLRQGPPPARGGHCPRWGGPLCPTRAFTGRCATSDPAASRRNVTAPTWRTNDRRVDAIVKRTIDIVCSAGILLVTAPAWGLISLWIKLADRGPRLLRPAAGGWGGRAFPMVKFRTMVVVLTPKTILRVDGGESRPGERHALQGSRRPADHPAGPGAEVLPRRTPTAVQRHSRRDVAGGPTGRRCPAKSMPTKPMRCRRLKVRPGLTGMADLRTIRPQLGGLLRLDLWYVDNWSPRTRRDDPLPHRPRGHQGRRRLLSFLGSSPHPARAARSFVAVRPRRSSMTTGPPPALSWFVSSSRSGGPSPSSRSVLADRRQPDRLGGRPPSSWSVLASPSARAASFVAVRPRRLAPRRRSLSRQDSHGEQGRA